MRTNNDYPPPELADRLVRGKYPDPFFPSLVVSNAALLVAVKLLGMNFLVAFPYAVFLLSANIYFIFLIFLSVAGGPHGRQE